MCNLYSITTNQAGSSRAVIRQAFPGIMLADRVERKRRLRRAIEKYRDNKDILGDPRTEVAPLCFPAAHA